MTCREGYVYKAIGRLAKSVIVRAIAKFEGLSAVRSANRDRVSGRGVCGIAKLL